MRSLPPIPFVLTLAVAFFATSCENAAPQVDAETSFRTSAVDMTEEASPVQSIETKVIRTGDMLVEVENVEEALDAVEGLVDVEGGLIAQSRVREGSGGGSTADITIRVPADRFSQLIAGLSALGEVRSESVATNDITRQYTDLEIRLNVKEETASRLRSLLADATGDLSDVLNVERELSRVVTEIEQMKGERRYLDDQVAMSTLSLTLRSPSGGVGSRLPPSLGDAIGESLQGMKAFFVWGLYYLVLLLPWMALGGLVWFAIHALRRKKEAA